MERVEYPKMLYKSEKENVIVHDEDGEKLAREKGFADYGDMLEAEAKKAEGNGQEQQPQAPQQPQSPEPEAPAAVEQPEAESQPAKAEVKKAK